jgi:hypothetical protein
MKIPLDPPFLKGEATLTMTPPPAGIRPDNARITPLFGKEGPGEIQSGLSAPVTKVNTPLFHISMLELKR